MNYLEAFEQLSSLSAVLCGFSFTFLALLLSLRDDRARTGWAIGLIIVAAAALLLPTFLFAYLAFTWSSLSPEKSGQVSLVSAIATFGFFLGVSMLLGTLAVAGSLRSRRMAYVSVTAALVVGLAIIAGVVVLSQALR